MTAHHTPMNLCMMKIRAYKIWLFSITGLIAAAILFVIFFSRYQAGQIIDQKLLSTENYTALIPEDESELYQNVKNQIIKADSAAIMTNYFFKNKNKREAMEEFLHFFFQSSKQIQTMTISREKNDKIIMDIHVFFVSNFTVSLILKQTKNGYTIEKFINLDDYMKTFRPLFVRNANNNNK